MNTFLKLHDASDGSLIRINYATIITMKVVNGQTELRTNGVGCIIRQYSLPNGVEHYPEIYPLTYYVRETPEQIEAFL